MDVAALLPHRDHADEDDGPLVVLPPTRWERRRALGSRVLEAGAAVLSPERGRRLPLPRLGGRRGALASPRAVLASKLLTSRRSVWSVASMWSAGSLYSAFSAGSVMSIGSAGSVLSIGSVGSVLSIGSAGSVLSIGSMGSIGAIGGLGQRPNGVAGDADDDATPTTDPMATLAVGARVLAVGALGSPPPPPHPPLTGAPGTGPDGRARAAGPVREQLSRPRRRGARRPPRRWR